MILIISPDEDFSATVAEQVSVELKLSCQIVGTQEEARKLPAGGYGLIVTTETLTGKWPIPAISIGRDDNKASRTPPVKMQDLLADMREILHKAATAEVLALGQGYHFLPMQKEIKSRGKSVALTDKEAQLLKSLADAGGLITKDALLKEIWGFEADMNTHTLETHIYRLREKLRELGAGEAIVAEGGGYKLEMT